MNKLTYIIVFLISILVSYPVIADVQNEESQTKPAKSCADTGNEQDKQACYSKQLSQSIMHIHNKRWRDQSLREYIKVLAHNNQFTDAFVHYEYIANPDTKAMAIRAIGYALNTDRFSEDEKNAYFDQLSDLALSINLNASKNVALTYLVIAEARADLFNRALETVKSIETVALQNKAYKEIAEYYSVSGEEDKILMALQNITDPAFLNKSYGEVASKLLKNGHVSIAEKLIDEIDDNYIKANSITALLTAYQKQNSKE